MRPFFTGGDVECGTENSTAAAAVRGRKPAAIRQKTTAWCNTSHGTPHGASIPLYGSTAAPEQHGSSKRHRHDSYAQLQTPKSTGCERQQLSGSHQQPHQWTLVQRQDGEMQRHYEQIGKQRLFRSYVQQRQRQCWLPDHRWRKEPNEGQQRSMVLSSPFQERETKQGRWLHHRGSSRGEQQERLPLLEVRGGKCLPEVRHRLCGQQLLQRNGEEPVRNQQQRQCHKGRNLQQQCYPPAPGTARCSAAATAAPSMLHAGAAVLGEGRSSSKVEVQQKLSHGRGDMSSSTSREITRRDAKTRSSKSHRERSSGELRIRRFGESSSPWYGDSVGKEKASDSEKVYSGSCRYNRRNSTSWELGICCNGEDGIVRQARSSSRQHHTDAYETGGAIPTGGSSECQLRNSSAPWSDYDSARESPAAAGLTSSSTNPLDLEATTVESATRRASPAASAASGSSTSARAVAVLEKTERRAIRKQQRAGRSWAAGERTWSIEAAEVEGAAAAKGTAAAGPCRITAAGACSSGISIAKRRNFTGEDVLDRFALAGAALVHKEGPLGSAAEGREGEEKCGTEDEKEKQFYISAAAGATNTQNSPHTSESALPRAAAVSPSSTPRGRSTTTAKICFLTSAATLTQSAVRAEADVGSMMSGVTSTATAACSCSCCSSCCRSVDYGGGATDAKGFERGALAASSDVRAKHEREIQSQDASRAGPVASGAAASGEAAQDAKKPATVATEEGELRAHLRRVEALNEVLLTNISSLYKTAKAELDRKDTAIAEKDRQIADLRLRLQRLTGGELH